MPACNDLVTTSDSIDLASIDEEEISLLLFILFAMLIVDELNLFDNSKKNMYMSSMSQRQEG